MKNSLKKKYQNLKVKLLKENKSYKNNVILVNRNRVDPVFRSIWCASILNSFKYQNVILFTKKKFSFTNTLYQNFGVRKLEFLSVRDIFF